MTRRKILSLLAGLPLVGRLAPKKYFDFHALMDAGTEIVRPTGYTIYAYFVNSDGIYQCAGSKRVDLLTAPMSPRELMLDRDWLSTRITTDEVKDA